MTDSYHFQIEPEPRAEGAKFRVGGVYRNYGGEVVFIEGGPKFVAARHLDGPCTDRICSNNRLSDGLSLFGVRAGEPANYHYNLIPGELVQRDGQWVAADSIGPFPSGATLKVAGDKIVGRVTPEPIRPALDWDTATPFDTFGADFIVTKGEVPTAPLHTSPTTDSAYPAIAGLLRG